MIKEFKLPELGENIESAQILKMLVAPGDKVKKDQTLFELETDKATVEVPSDFDGVIESVKIKDGEQADVGSAILTYNDSGETAAEESREAVPEKKKETSEKVISETAAASKTGAKTVDEKPPDKKITDGGIFEFKLPELGENIESAVILKVQIKPGDKIQKDQTIIEIETDKATVEVPSEIEGVVKSVNVKDGDEAKVGQVIAVFENVSGAAEKAESKSESELKLIALKDEKSSAETESVRTPALSKKKMPGKIAPASPSVRRFAREIGVDIHKVRGSGTAGRISIDDVKAYAKNLNEKLRKGSAQAAALGLNVEPLPDFSKYGEIDIQPMSNIRKKTAQHLSYAWATVPHVTQFDKADITELEKLRKQYAPLAEAAGGKLTVTAILLKITASALKLFPQFNASVDMEKNSVIYKNYFNIGIAVDTPKGLLVPVVKNVDKKNIIQLSKELTEISAKAREGKLSIDEMQGGNFSISNLGGIGGTYFSPIVNSPEVAILGISRGAFEQVYKNGKFETRLMLPISLSYDHRVIDGAAGAKFIKWISGALENPFLLSLQG